MRIDLCLQHPDFQTALFLFILQTLVHQLFDLAAHCIYGLSDESDLVLALQRFLLAEIPLRNSVHMVYQPVNRFSDRIGKQKRHGNSKEHAGDKDQANRLHEHQAVILQICHVHDFDHQGAALGFLVIRYQMWFPVYLVLPRSTFFLSSQIESIKRSLSSFWFSDSRSVAIRSPRYVVTSIVLPLSSSFRRSR